MTAIELPIIGQGSQPEEEDGSDLEFMQLPEEMTAYSRPEIHADLSSPSLQAASAILDELLLQLKNYQPQQQVRQIDLMILNQDNRKVVDQVLGEGEVSIKITGDMAVRIQESSLAGIWRVQGLNCQQQFICDYLQIGDIPHLLKTDAFNAAIDKLSIAQQQLPEGVMNAPPLISELNAKIAAFKPGVAAHVINLSLLPQTEQDLAFLNTMLGVGQVTILSRGYGNCRITATNTRNVWWVQYFNSQDTMILNTLEVTDIPGVACAAIEDIEDSLQRLQDIVEVS